LEHRILETLVRHSERIVTRSLLMTEVWGPNRGDSGALRVYIGSLRKKLEVDPNRPQHILTELGVGYRLVMDVGAPSDPAPSDPASPHPAPSHPAAPH
jgi:two-component system KDP operon response regulator KdpE